MEVHRQSLGHGFLEDAVFYPEAFGRSSSENLKYTLFRGEVDLPLFSAYKWAIAGLWLKPLRFRIATIPIIVELKGRFGRT